MPDGTVLVSVVMGFEWGIVSDAKLGAQLAVEYQANPELSIGVALAGGTGLADENEAGVADESRLPTPRLWLLAARLFGQWNATGADWAATTFGVGLGVMTTGLSYLTLDAGEAVGYLDDSAVPHAAAFAALAVPLTIGKPFGSKWERPETELYLGALGGLVVPFGATGNAASVEVGMQGSVGRRGADWAVSIGDSQSTEH